MRSEGKVKPCPKCGSKETQVVAKRYWLYPSGCFILLGLTVGMIHQLQAPIEYECLSCDHRFAKRTPLGIVGLVLFIGVAVVIAYFFVIYILQFLFLILVQGL
ncbi:MAG: hypothetical protein CMO55_11560 [Verrucomicrobiales bacterium]|nr:hypothetical protein [Verrucomicrobiales bacterium]